MSKLDKKYGFFTAVSMVVGIVIGSGVFKSAGDVLNAAGGNLTTAILAWLIGGMIMVVSSYTFSLVAVSIEKSSGIVDYMETATGKKGGYLIAWFLNFVYYPTLIGIITWLAGSITASILNISSPSGPWLLGLLYLFTTFLLNFISPTLSGRWQVSATIIKLIPLGLIAFVGLIVGFVNGTTIENFTIPATNASTGSLATAVAVTAFAYEGWIIATSINSELKNAKKVLPKALIIGSITVITAYILFFLGLSGVLSNNEAIELSGSLDTTVIAAKRLFGSFLGSTVVVLVLVSVLGTLNGLIMGGIRGMYSISVRDIGPKPEIFKKCSKNNATVNSGILSLVVTLFWLVIWYGNFQGWWNNNFMDTSILPIVFIYGAYIFIYIYIMRSMNQLSFINRYIIPLLASAGGLYLIYGAFMSNKLMFLYFFLIVAVIMLVGMLTYRKHSLRYIFSRRP
jgi:APA family basic amino acid/polyamine antiporter